MGPTRSRLPLTLLLLFAGWSGLPGLWAQTLPRTPYEHRALYLYNFAKYTQWPRECFPDEKSSFVLGILGQDPFGGDLDIIKGKHLKQRKIEVKYYSSADQVAGCHLLFISASESYHLPAVLQALENQHLLTVTEVGDWTGRRAIINLVVEKKYLGFEIDRAAAEKAHLKLDTQLLRLARNGQTINQETP